jgi:hypothetical protein
MHSSWAFYRADSNEEMKAERDDQHSRYLCEIPPIENTSRVAELRQGHHAHVKLYIKVWKIKQLPKSTSWTGGTGAASATS